MKKIASIIQHIKATKAETMAEILISTATFAIGGVAAVTLITTAMNANTSTKERLIAYNFAREGVESMRNIRDSNWLRFPGNHDGCWDVHPDTTDSTTCETSLKLGTPSGQDYIIYPQLTDTSRLFSWNVVPATGSNDTTIYKALINGSLFYTHDPTGLEGYEATPYHRTVSIQKSTTFDTYDTFIVSSTVKWESKGRERSVTFRETLINR